MLSKTAVSTQSPSPDNTIHIQIQLRLPLILLGLLALTAVFLPDRVWNTLLVGMGGLFLVGYGWTWRLARNLHLNRRLRFGWVSIGDRLSEQFELRNDGAIPGLWVELLDHSTVPGYNASIVQSVGSHNHLAWRESAVCLRRGQYIIGPMTICCGDPFGLFTASKQRRLPRRPIPAPNPWNRAGNLRRRSPTHPSRRRSRLAVANFAGAGPGSRQRKDPPGGRLIKIED